MWLTVVIFVAGLLFLAWFFMEIGEKIERLHRGK